MNVHPGQTEPNEFELAILYVIADQNPTLKLQFQGLRVLSRKFTGVGSYTDFLVEDSVESKLDTSPGLKGHITMPNVPSGLGAVLFCKASQPECLEVFTYGDELWDGAFEGFGIVDIE